MLKQLLEDFRKWSAPLAFGVCLFAFLAMWVTEGNAILSEVPTWIFIAVVVVNLAIRIWEQKRKARHRL